MQGQSRFRLIAFAALFAVASLSSGCGLFKKCNTCPSFSKTEQRSHQAVALGDESQQNRLN